MPGTFINGFGRTHKGYDLLDPALVETVKNCYNS